MYQTMAISKLLKRGNSKYSVLFTLRNGRAYSKLESFLSAKTYKLVENPHGKQDMHVLVSTIILAGQ